jgi:hypothetical protein
MQRVKLQQARKAPLGQAICESEVVLNNGHGLALSVDRGAKATSLLTAFCKKHERCGFGADGSALAGANIARAAPSRDAIQETGP